MIFPDESPLRVILTHTRAEPLAGTLQTLDTGSGKRVLGYVNHGATLDLEGMLFINRCTWAHCIYEIAHIMGQPIGRFLTSSEIDAVDGHTSPMGIVIHRRKILSDAQK